MNFEFNWRDFSGVFTGSTLSIFSKICSCGDVNNSIGDFPHSYLYNYSAIANLKSNPRTGQEVTEVSGCRLLFVKMIIKLVTL